MKRLQFNVPRLRSYSADAAFELYGDLGSGTIDYEHPLPPGRVRLWPAAALLRGHLLDAHLGAAHLDAAVRDGHLHDIHLWGGHLEPVLAVAVASPRYVFGRFRHAIRMFDAAGNGSAIGATEFAHTINESPPIAATLRRVGWDDVDGRVLFYFEPVRFHAVAGG